MTHAYSPKTLALRWACSAETIRQMCKRGELTFIKPGPKLIRITAREVERFECQNTGSLSTEAITASPTPAPLAGYESRLARMNWDGQNWSLARYGAPEPDLPRDG